MALPTLIPSRIVGAVAARCESTRRQAAVLAGRRRSALRSPARAARSLAIERGVGRLAVRGPITAAIPSSLGAEIAWLSVAGARAIVIEIDSQGGDVAAALAAHDLIRVCDLPTVSFTPDAAHSAASLLVLGCDRSVVAPEARILVHRSAGGEERSCAAADERILAVYRERSGMDLQAWFDGAAEVYLDSVAAVTHGFADEIGGEWRAFAMARALAAGDDVWSPRQAALAAARVA